MDLVADALTAALASLSSGRFAVEQIRPRMRRRFGGLATGRAARTAFNLDRFTGRFVDYPVLLRRIANCYDICHIADHSYAHLALSLPVGRTGVYCHDLDAFRCLIEPMRDPRPVWFRKVARRILNGLQRACVVFYSTGVVREEILAHGLVPADRLVHAPYGVSDEFTPMAASAPSGFPFVLHVGSCVPRKRIDVLLDVVARLRADAHELRLVHVGGPFTREHELQIDSSGLRDATVSLSDLSREEMADLYRSAALVLLPSESEGFGLPVIEALACGTRVVASDIPVLREVGGAAVTYCPVGDIGAWSTAAQSLIRSPDAGPSVEVRLAQAAQFTWCEHARIILDSYESILEGRGPGRAREGDQRQ